jgi:hypothetical protein
VERKYAHFYLHVLPYSWDKSTWIARIDDDSATDVGALMDRLQEYDPGSPVHLIAHETTNNLRDHHKRLYRKYGFTDAMMLDFQHTWEVSVDSYAASAKLMSNADVRSMYFDIMDWDAEEQPWADANYCYALRMCGIFPHHAGFLSKDSNVRKFSFLGGHFTHIHYVAPDLKEFYANWGFFKDAMDKRFAGEEI